MDSRARFITILCLVWAGIVSGQDIGVPRLVVLNNDIQLPQMLEDEYITNAFVLSNSTSAPVQIDSVRPTCGCTFAKAETNVVAPGARIKVVFGFHSSRQSGTFRKTIYAITPDQQLGLVFTAHVGPLFNVTTASFDLGELPRSESKVLREFSLTVNDVCGTVSIGRVEVDQKYLGVTALYDQDKKIVRMAVTVDGAACPNPFINDVVRLYFDCKGTERLFAVSLSGAFKD